MNSSDFTNVCDKKYLLKVIFFPVFIVCFYSLPAQAKYGVGTGEPNDPYLIYTAEQLNTIGIEPNDRDKHFKLMADIDLSIYTGSQFNIIGHNWATAFSGVFDGNGHKISNFTYSSTGKNNIGLFGFVSYLGIQYVAPVIKDLVLIDPNIDAGTGNHVGALIGTYIDVTIINCRVEGGSIRGEKSVGGLVGEGDVGNIKNCYSSASVLGDIGVGGLIGICGGWGLLSHTDRPKLLDCHTDGSVSGRDIVGGLVGWFSDGGRIFNCNATGKVSGVRNVGGLVGANGGWGDIYGDTISNCYSTGDVSGTDYVGGLVGTNGDNEGFFLDITRQTISNCYSTGNVSAVTNAGGLVGYNWGRGTIKQCYCIGKVEGNNDVGGLIGCKYDGTIEDSFWDIQTSGQTTSDGGIGKTTTEMQTENTFLEAGWDFIDEVKNGVNDTWQIDEGQDYPRFAIEHWPGGPLGRKLSEFVTGSGTEDDPYLIYTPDELNMVGLFPADWDKHFRLMADIDLSDYKGTEFNTIGRFTQWKNGEPFTGTFDGNGHTISNFSYTSENAYYLGLFGYVGARDGEAVIKNLGLIDPNIDAETCTCVGSLIGWLSWGVVTNCYVQGGSVKGNDSVGGLIGYSDTNTAEPYFFPIISKSCSTTTVSGNSYIGGLVGKNLGEIKDSYSISNVLGNSQVGGLVGSNGRTRPVGDCIPGKITNCYSSGSVSGNELVGGLLGQDSMGEISNSFWDVESSGQLESAGGVGKITAEMKKKETFKGWDFADVWDIVENQTYPFLRQDSNYDYSVDMLDLATPADYRPD